MITGYTLALLHALPILEWRRSPIFPEGGYHVPGPWDRQYLSDVFRYAPRSEIRKAFERYNEQQQEKPGTFHVRCN